MRCLEAQPEQTVTASELDIFEAHGFGRRHHTGKLAVQMLVMGLLQLLPQLGQAHLVR